LKHSGGTGHLGAIPDGAADPPHGRGRYTPPPADLPGVPGVERVRPKTPVRGGGGLRRRWKDQGGNIYEWDSQHGRLEKYNGNGRHLGEFDPYTGEQMNPADPNRRVEP
jgi:hypothetical protein